MIRTSFILAIAALGLSACRDDLNDSGTPTPTPIPLVTPTPLPGTDDEDTTDGTDTADNGTDGSTINGDGAIMATPNERVGVVSLDSTRLSQPILTVQRTNGEIWEFQLISIPTSRIGTTIIYRNRGLVFGSIEGIIVFDDGVAMSIEASARIQ